MRLHQLRPVEKGKVIRRSKPYRYTGPITPVYSGGNRPRLLRHIAAAREVFYRFSTKPDWKAADRQSTSAALAMQRK